MAIGLTSCSITTVPDEGDGGGDPGSHEPAGFTEITHQPWNSAPNSDATPDDNCWLRTDATGPRISITQDASAPESPSNVLQLLHPAGTEGDGGTVFNLWTQDDRFDCTDPTKYRELYVSFWLKLESDWQNHAVGSKIFFFRLPTSGTFNGFNSVFLSLDNNGNSGSSPDADAIIVKGTQQDLPWQGGARDLPANVDPTAANLGTAGSDKRGEWVHIEVYLSLNTTGSTSDGSGANGVYRWWVDGTHAGEYTDVMFQDPADDWGWRQMSLVHTYGGLGDPPSTDQRMWIDNIYISGGN